ncbi:PAS domain-containing protein [Falsiroseomonas sp.]|uniref:PAS domain-containing protein n=1 Tax=Falsiroseomonas sp. TaxID=2870721 RepID=UPI002737071C|nr:PAS domain-containing protein [Falsiroseomonas sp.]MDP3414606.1 PAS domain-containing protein [Falsiroseomonas sp.]
MPELGSKRKGYWPRIPALRLRGHLVLLVLAVLLPALAFGAAASWDALRSRNAAAEARLIDTAQAMSAAIDAHIAGHIAALTVLAAFPQVDEAAFADLARNTGVAFGGWVVVMDRDGRPLLNTHPRAGPLPGPGGALGPGGGGRWVEQVFTTGRPVVSDLATGRASGETVAFVFAPMLRDGAVWRVVGMPLMPARLSALLAQREVSGPGAAALTDAGGTMVGHSHAADRLVGQVRPPRPEDAELGRTGILRGRSLLDGAPLRTAFRRLGNAPGWMVWVNEPESAFAASRRGPMLALAGGGALALVIGLAFATALTRRLLRPVEALVAHAEAVAAGQVLSSSGVAPAKVPEFERLRLAVAAAESALRERGEELQRVQRIGRVGGFMIDFRTGESRRSAEYLDLHGSAAEAEYTHESWIRELHPEDRDRAEAHFLHAIASGATATSYAQDYRVVTQAGTRWISARAQVERDAEGRAIRMIGAHVDVTALKLAEQALRDSEERLRLALEAAELGAWEVDLRHGRATRTERTLEIFGFGSEEQFGAFPSWRDRIHPEDRSRLDEAVERVRSGAAERYLVQYRFQRPDGQWRWVESHGRAVERDATTGTALRLIGTTQDVTARREAQERQALLSRELDHRAKNALAVVQAALRLTPRHDAAAFATAIEGRVMALSRAHTLLAAAHWTGAELHSVLQGEVAAFLTPSGPAATFEGPTLALAPAAVQALSMAFHELATNAAKYGALSQPAGRVAVDWAVVEEAGVPRLHLRWAETGGPAPCGLETGGLETGGPEIGGPETGGMETGSLEIGGPETGGMEAGRLEIGGTPTHRGFGSTLIEATVVRQLGGRLTVEWRREGLLWQAWLPLNRVQAAG